MNDYEQLAQKPLGDNILAQISATARDILEAKDEVIRREEALKDAQKRLKSLQEDILPELMSEAGQEEITTIDGLRVSVKELVRGQPTRDNEDEAYAWLRESGNGGIIKSKIEADLGRAHPSKIADAKEALASLGILAVSKHSVHWQTLGALVREKLARGEQVPLELLGVQVWKMAEVKPKSKA